MLIYIDESGIEEELIRQHGYAGRGKKIYDDVSGKKFARTNMIAGYINGVTIAEYVYKDNTDATFMIAWVEQLLVPSLKKGQVVVMDNASFHKNKKIRELIEKAGCRLIYLPPYSPDLNPIEHYWANMKKKLRGIAKHFQSLMDAVCYCFLQTTAC
jgi:transposase